jgi:hypothetical protein
MSEDLDGGGGGGRGGGGRRRLWEEGTYDEWEDALRLYSLRFAAWGRSIGKNSQKVSAILI